MKSACRPKKYNIYLFGSMGGLFFLVGVASKNQKNKRRLNMPTNINNIEEREILKIIRNKMGFLEVVIENESAYGNTLVENHRLNFIASDDLKEALLVDVDDNLQYELSDEADQCIVKTFDEIENCKIIKKEDISNN